MKQIRDLVPSPDSMRAAAIPPEPTKALLERVDPVRRLFGLDVMKVLAGAIPRISRETGHVWAYYVAKQPEDITFDDWAAAIERLAMTPDLERPAFEDLRSLALRARDARLRKERPKVAGELAARSQVQRVGCAQIGEVVRLFEARSAGKITREDYDLATDEVFAGRTIPAEVLEKMQPPAGEKEKEP